MRTREVGLPACLPGPGLPACLPACLEPAAPALAAAAGVSVEGGTRLGPRTEWDACRRAWPLHPLPAAPPCPYRVHTGEEPWRNTPGFSWAVRDEPDLSAAARKQKQALEREYYSTYIQAGGASGASVPAVCVHGWLCASAPRWAGVQPRQGDEHRLAGADVSCTPTARLGGRRWCRWSRRAWLPGWQSCAPRAWWIRAARRSTGRCGTSSQRRIRHSRCRPPAPTSACALRGQQALMLVSGGGCVRAPPNAVSPSLHPCLQQGVLSAA